MTRFRTLLLALYAVSVALLAWLLPCWPSVSFSALDFRATLLGFSPDGRLIATTTASPLDAKEYDVHLWDFAGRPWFGPPRLVATRHFDRLANLGFGWRDDPGRVWLFWQCVAADDPQARADELFPGVTLDDDRLDPLEPRLRFRCSADGRHYAVRLPERQYEIRERTGRVVVTTPMLEATPRFGPGPDDLTVLESTGRPLAATVVRYDLRTGLATLSRIFDLPPTPDRPFCIVLTADGRRVNGVGRSYDIDSGALAAQGASCDLLAWLAPARRFVEVEDRSGGSGRATAVVARIWSPDGSLAVNEVRPGGGNQPASAFIAATADGSAFALSSFDSPDYRSQDWPTWLRDLYMGWLGQPFAATARLTVYSTADGRKLGVVPHCASTNRVTGEGTAAFSPDGRWFAAMEGRSTQGKGGLEPLQSMVHVYAYPLHRPWLGILGVAALPPLALAALVAVVRRLRRPRAAESKGATP